MQAHGDDSARISWALARATSVGWTAGPSDGPGASWQG